MRFGPVQSAAIGLAAGIATSTAAIALTATDLLPVWTTTLLLFLAGGLAAGLAAPVRATVGALLGGATGLFAAILQAFVMIARWTPVPEQYIKPPPLLPIALTMMIFYVPVYAAMGAAGALLRARVRPSLSARHGPCASGRRQWAGIAAGALVIVVPLALSVVVAPRLGIYTDGSLLNGLFLLSGLAGGFTAGFLSPGGARAGTASGLLSAVFGLGAIAVYFVWQASTSPMTGDGVPQGLWPIAIMILGFWVMPAALLAGALGGGIRKPSGEPNESPEPEL